MMLVLQFKKLKTTQKIKEIGDKIIDQDKYITTSDFNRFSVAIFDERLKRIKLATTTDTVEQRAIKNEKKIGKLQTYNVSLFIGQNYFSSDGLQNFLLFQRILNTFTMSFGLTETIVVWESKGLSNEKIKPPTTANNNLSPKMKWYN